MTYEGSELAGLQAAVNYYSWIADEFRPYLRGRCLEVGAGRGTFSKFLLNTAIEALVCIEPAANLLPLLEAELIDASKPVVVAPTTLEEFAQTPKEHFDCLVCLNVFEHIEDDAAAMEQVRNLLKWGGHLCYTKRRLKKLAEQTGFAVEQLRFFNFARVVTWFLMGKILRWRTWGKSPVVAYDRLVIPFVRFVESFVALLFGQSLLMVARREI